MNKNVKRIFSVLLCGVLMFSMFTLTGYAQTEPAKAEIVLECSSEQIKVGDEFEVYVYLKNVTGLETVSLTGDWNQEELELISAINPYPFDFKLGNMFSYDTWFDYSFSYDEPFDGDVYAMRLVFIALADCTARVNVRVQKWNDKWGSDLDYSVVPVGTYIDLPIETAKTKFNYTSSEETIEIGEIVEIAVLVENCVDVISTEVEVYFDLEYFEFYDIRENYDTSVYCVYSGSGRCISRMNVHILDDHIFGDKKILMMSLKAIKSGTSDITVKVKHWGGKNQPADAVLPITVSNEVYVDKFKYDVNLDGFVTAFDARLALRASARIDDLYGKQHYAADVNRDQMITAADARLILRKAAKLD